MHTSVCRRVVAAAIAGAATLGSALPAAAQFKPKISEPAVGEGYHIEGGLSFWNADPFMIVSSEALGIPGSDVDLVDDLGVEQKQLRELRVVLRPAVKHKFRIHYTPLNYEAEAIVQREFVFNGLRYRVGLPVNTSVDLTTYKFGYEYDFLYRSRGYAGVMFDLKYTNVDVTLDSPLGAAFYREVAPIPSIGFTGRGYPAKNVSITGEVSFFKIPENLGGEDFGGRYVDYDFYGTFNFTEYVGGQFGFKSIDVDYFQDFDRGHLRFRGWYFGGVLRY